MYVGGVPLSAPASSDKPATMAAVGPIDFEAIVADEAAKAGQLQADPQTIDMETVAATALGIADEEEAKKKREKQLQDEADGPGTSSAAPSAEEAFQMAQDWLMANYQVPARIRDSLQSAGADATETATPGAAKVGDAAPATVESAGAETAAAVKPPAAVAFI